MYKPTRKQSLSTNSVIVLVLDFSDSRTMSNKFLLFINQMAYGILLSVQMERDSYLSYLWYIAVFNLFLVFHELGSFEEYW